MSYDPTVDPIVINRVKQRAARRRERTTSARIISHDRVTSTL